MVVGQLEPYPMIRMGYNDSTIVMLVDLEPHRNGKVWYKTGIPSVAEKFTNNREIGRISVG